MSVKTWWGWVPNISGDVCDNSYVEQQIAKNKGKRDYSYESQRTK